MNHKTSTSIAVYSGVNPSTTFIERLIDGLSEAQETILLFGIIKKTRSYEPQVSVIGYKNNRLSKLFHFFQYWLLLKLNRPKDLNELDHALRSKGKFSWNDRLKAYPVLWHRPSVFHVQWAKGLDDWMWVQQFGIKLVLSLRGAHINYSPIGDAVLANSYKMNFPKVDAFHAVSKAIGNEAEGYGAPADRIKLVYSGLDLQPNSILDNNSSENFQIISVGRSHWKKGYHYALDACKLLKQKGFNFKYSIVGAANQIELLYQIKDLKLESHVELIEQLSFDLVQKAMVQADLLWLPSIEEGIANVVLEAMSLGTIVLSTDCGGMEEVIEEGKTGFLVPMRDPVAFAERSIYISTLHAFEIEQIKINAKDKIKEQHSASQMTKGMQQLYQFALEQ